MKLSDVVADLDAYFRVPEVEGEFVPGRPEVTRLRVAHSGNRGR